MKHINLFQLLAKIFFAALILSMSTVAFSQSSFGDVGSTCQDLSNDDNFIIQAIGTTSFCGPQTRGMYVSTSTVYNQTLTYQWYISSNNTLYTEVNNSNNDSLLNQNINADRWFKCTVYCGNNDSLSLGPLFFDFTALVTPSVAIAITAGSNPTCSGSSITFTATPTNGGSTPSYQWKVDGSNVGTNSSTYTTSGLTNNQTVTCVMTSNAACASPASSTSNGITVTVTPLVTPQITITQTSGSNPACQNDVLSFGVATQQNQGTAPTYNWLVNNISVGSGSTYSGVISVGDVNTVSCQLTSNAACATPSQVTSNVLNIDVNPLVTPSISIAITSGGNPSCSGSPVTLTATPTAGGTAPSYQWKVNNFNVGTNSPTYTASNFNNGDIVTCVLTSNAPCRTSNTATSNEVTVLRTNTVVPAVSISLTQGTNPSCAGTLLQFTAIAANQGTTPIYQWRRNGNNVGTNSTTFSSSSLNNGDIITVTVTSSLDCASPSSAPSLDFVVQIVSSLTPVVTIEFDAPEPFCPNTNVTFNAVPTHGGTNPQYTWTIDGSPAGSGASLNALITTAGNHTVQVAMVSNASCLSTPNANSGVVNFSVQNSVAPTVQIVSSAGSIVCPTDELTFEVSSQSGQGANPDYQWRINNILQPINADNITVDVSDYTSGFSIYCTMISDLACANPGSANSTTIQITVTPSAPAAVNVTVSDASVCDGTQVTFQASGINGGNSPQYQWKLNNSNVGPNSTTYQSSALNDGDIVTCQLTSSAACASPQVVNSAQIVMEVFPLPEVLLSVLTTGTLCETDNVVLQSIFTQGELPMSGTISEFNSALPDIDVNASSLVVNSSVVINNDGSYVLDYTELIDNNGCAFENAAPVSVQVIRRPLVTIGASSFVYCEEEVLPAVALSSQPNDGSTQYTWITTGSGSYTSSAGYAFVNTIPGGAIADVFPSSASESSSDVCVLARYNGCESLVPDCFEVTVNAKPHIVELSDTTFCGGENIGPLTLVANPALSGIDFEWQLTSGSSLGFGVSGTNTISGVANELVGVQQREVTVNAELGTCADTMTFAVLVVPTPGITSDLQQLFCSSEGSITIPLENNGETNQTTWELLETEENQIGLIVLSGMNTISINTPDGITSPADNTILVTPQDTQLGKTCYGETEALEVRILHNPAVQTLSPDTICSGGGFSASLSANGQTTSFEWDADGNNSSLVFHPISNSINNNAFVVDSVFNNSNSLQNASIDLWAVYSESSTFCFGDTVSVSINVNPDPDIDFTDEGSVLCSGDEFVSVISSETSFPSTNWTWSVNTSSGITGGTFCVESCQDISDEFQNPTDTAGSVNYYFTQFIDGTNCFLLDTLSISVNPIPGDQVDLIVADVICAGSENILITTAQMPENDLSWTMSPPDAGSIVTGGQNGSVVYLTLNADATADITFSTTITDEAGCTNLINNTVPVNADAEIPDFLVVSVNDGTPGMTLVSLPANQDATYQWGYTSLDGDWAETELPGENDQDYIVGQAFDSDKLYWVEITLNGCVTKIFFQTLTSALDGNYTSGIVVYPNPVSDFLYIRNQSLSNVSAIEVVDQSGRIIRNILCDNGQRIWNADVSDLSPGLYVLRVYSGDGSNLLRFIKS